MEAHGQTDENEPFSSDVRLKKTSRRSSQKCQHGIVQPIISMYIQWGKTNLCGIHGFNESLFGILQKHPFVSPQ